jgi:hypothetical protein
MSKKVRRGPYRIPLSPARDRRRSPARSARPCASSRATPLSTPSRATTPLSAFIRASARLKARSPATKVSECPSPRSAKPQQGRRAASARRDQASPCRYESDRALSRPGQQRACPRSRPALRRLRSWRADRRRLARCPRRMRLPPRIFLPPTASRHRIGARRADFESRDRDWLSRNSFGRPGSLSQNESPFRRLPGSCQRLSRRHTRRLLRPGLPSIFRHPLRNSIGVIHSDLVLSSIRTL